MNALIEICNAHMAAIAFVPYWSEGSKLDLKLILLLEGASLPSQCIKSDVPAADMSVCGHGTELTRRKLPRLVFAGPKARRWARASSQGGV